LRYPLLDADDAQRMLAAIEQLGARIQHVSDPADAAGPAPAKLKVIGVTGRWRPTSPVLTLNLNNAGTATRFLAASALLSPTPITIDGNARMRQRPIGQLITSLRALGAHCEEL